MPYTFTGMNFPLWANLNSTNGTIFGTPDSPGTFVLAETVKDAANATDTGTVTIQVVTPSGGLCDPSATYDTSNPATPFEGGTFYFRVLQPNVTFSTYGPWPEDISVDSGTGTVHVSPGVVPGLYSLGIQCVTPGGETPVLYNPSFPVDDFPGWEFPGFGNETADPVNTATGEISDTQNVFSLGGPLSLRFDLFYSSLLGASGFSGTMSNNWMHNFEMKLSLSGTAAYVTLMGGKRIRFTVFGTTWTLQSPDPHNYQLSNDGSGFQLLDPSTLLTYRFSNTGILMKIQDRNGNALTITQGAFGPTDISDGLGRTLHLTYSGGRVATVTDQSGRMAAFGYAGNALSSFKDLNGNTTNYTYTSVSGLPNGLPTMTNLLVAKQRPAGNTPYTQAYDSLGNVTKQTDSLGNNTALSYNTSSHVTTVTDPRGNKELDTNLDQIVTTQTTDANNNSTSYTYDANFRRIAVKDRLGNTTSATYDPQSGYPASITDALGNVTTLNYTTLVQNSFSFRNLSGFGFADGTSISLSYDNSGNILSATDQAGKVSTYTYNSRGQALTATNPLGGVTKLSYNPDGTVASDQDSAGNATAYTYDSAKRLTGIAFADGTLASYTYDLNGRLLTATDQRGNTTSAAYDANGNLLSVTDPLNKAASARYDTDDLIASITNRAGNTTFHQYDALGNLTALTNGAGEKYTFTFDNLNRLSAAADSSGKGPSYAYDNEDRLIGVTDALGNTASLKRDNLGRVIQTSMPLGDTYDYAYDGHGRLRSATDALSETTTLSYDPRGLLTSAVGPGNVSASYLYDEIGGLSSVIDPNGNQWTKKHDSSGRLTSETDPLGRTTTYTYDGRNRIRAASNPAGFVQIVYDAAGNMTQRRYSDTTALNYAFDANGHFTAAGGVTLGYDGEGRIVSSNGLTIARDGAGRIASVTYAPGKTVTYTYDSRGLPAKILDWANGSVNLTHDAARRLTSLGRSNGVATQYTYDPNGRVIGIVDLIGGTNLSSLSLTRDALGRVISETRNTPLQPSPAPGVSGQTYDSASQITGANYDALGRITADSLRNYTWNMASQLTGVSGADITASYSYDDFSMRISRTVSGKTENYVVNYALGLPSIAIVRSGSTDQRYYVYMPDGSLLYAIDAAGNVRHFYHFDESGSTIFLTSDAGAITDSYGITPYGETVTVSGSTNNLFTWQGRFGVMQEGSTGVYYMRARYYDSTSARFLTRDPFCSVAPAEVDPYQYALGDPVGLSDPAGLKTTPMGFGNFYTTPMGFRNFYRRRWLKRQLEQDCLEDFFNTNIYTRRISRFPRSSSTRSSPAPSDLDRWTLDLSPSDSNRPTIGDVFTAPTFGSVSNGDVNFEIPQNSQEITITVTDSLLSFNDGTVAPSSGETGSVILGFPQSVPSAPSSPMTPDSSLPDQLYPAKMLLPPTGAPGNCVKRPTYLDYTPLRKAQLYNFPTCNH
jgi:RHS repeat-associated protein